MRFFGILLLFLGLSMTAAAEDAPAEFSMATSAFLDQGALPVMYTCDGKNLSPEISWTHPPANTKSFAVVMTDPEAPNGVFYHWVVANIPATTLRLEEGVKTYPAGAVVGVNSWQKNEYGGPCPPKGSVHSYVITLYALDSNLTVSSSAGGKEVLDAMKGHILKEVKLGTVYSRWLK